MRRELLGGSGEEKEERRRKEGARDWGLCFLFGPWHHWAQVRHAGKVHIGSVWQLPWQQTHESPCHLGVKSLLDSKADLKVISNANNRKLDNWNVSLSWGYWDLSFSPLFTSWLPWGQDASYATCYFNGSFYYQKHKEHRSLAMD